MSASTQWATPAAYGLALVLTLVLASWLTPRRWWRRPTAGTLALVGGATLALGMLFAALLAPPLPPPAMALSSAAVLRYRVVDDLNLRAAKATGAPRVAVLPAGTLVTRSGAADGDWWKVHARVGGREIEGWASSLWLRRVDEGRGGTRGRD